MHPRDKRIKIENCEHRKLYRLHARNIRIGVWNANPHVPGGDGGEFIGIRTKFGWSFLDGENHYDASSFATASPLEIIGELPPEIELVQDPHLSISSEEWSQWHEANGERIFEERKKLFAWLDEQEKKLFEDEGNAGGRS